jgi:hypothetical protein
MTVSDINGCGYLSAHGWCVHTFNCYSLSGCKYQLPLILPMHNVAGQVVDILCRDKPDGVSDNFFKDYVEMIWYGAPRAADGLL